MKTLYKLFLISCTMVLSVQVNAQAKAKNVTVCNIIQANDAANVSKDAPLILYVQDSVSNQKLAIVFSQNVIKKMSFNPRQKLVNQNACISGVIEMYNNQPAIIISDEKQINVSEKPNVNRKSANG